MTTSKTYPAPDNVPHLKHYEVCHWDPWFRCCAYDIVDARTIEQADLAAREQWGNRVMDIREIKR